MRNYIAYCRRGMARYWLCFLPAVYLLTEFWLSLCFCFLHMSCWQSYKNVKLHLKSSLALRWHLSWLQKKSTKKRKREIWYLFRMCNWNGVYEMYPLLSQSNLIRPEVLLLHRKPSIQPELVSSLITDARCWSILVERPLKKTNKNDCWWLGGWHFSSETLLMDTIWRGLLLLKYRT